MKSRTCCFTGHRNIPAEHILLCNMQNIVAYI